MRLFYATDVHGSTRCFTKFVNAGKFYGADAVLLGGDVAGKAVVPLVQENGRYAGRFLGEPVSVEAGPELEELEKKIANTGYYSHRCTQEEAAALASDAAAQERLFLELICARVREWAALAEERLEPAGIPCYVNAGNDDPPELDAVLDEAGWVQFLEGRVVELPDGTEVASCGYANMTPWACPRDVEEPELADRLEAVIEKVRDPERAIFNFHCPPYDTGIDSGPKLGEDFRMRSGAGGIEMQPVGSTACRAAIERHQPLLGLHGHLHESRGVHKLGRTICINPGSEYNEGILRGALIELRKGKVKSHQFTAG
ncbi:MAG: metallophosphoesterase [Actinobacteria bacterium]|nr:metallophosphoesterase [Actinomycetota bacterium]